MMSSADTALLAYLQSELLILSSETRKKQPEAKQRLDSILTDLKALPTASTTLFDYLRNSQELSNMCTMIMDGPLSSRLMPNIVNISFRLINQGAYPNAKLPALLDILTRAVMSAPLNSSQSMEEEMQLRCLQMAIPIWQHYQMDLMNDQGRLLQWMLYLCFRLCESRHLSVNNAAMAITRQLIIYLFEVCSLDDHASVRDLLISVVTDVCSWLDNIEGASPLFIHIHDQPVLTPSRVFTLELLESILSGNQSPIVNHFQSVIAILRDIVCPIIVRKLNERMEFNLSVRLWRIVVVLLKEYNKLVPLECEIFLSLCIRILEDNDQLMDKLLVLESVLDIFGDIQVFYALFTLSGNLEKTSTVFPDLIRAVFRALANELTDTAVLSKGVCVYNQSCVKMALLSTFEKSPSSVIPDTYALFLLFKGIKSIGDLLVGSALNKNSHLVDPAKLITMANGKVLAIIIDRLSGLNLDGKWRQESLKMYDCWTELCAVLQSKESLTLIIDCLGSIAIPATANPYDHFIASIGAMQVSETSLMTSKLLINVALKTGEVLGANWNVVIMVIHGIDCYASFKAKKLNSSLPSAPSADSLPPTVHSPIQGVKHEMDFIGELTEIIWQLLESSSKLSNGAFLCVLHGYESLIMRTLGFIANQDNTPRPHLLLPQIKLKQLCVYNNRRFPKALECWSCLCALLKSICQCSEISVRQVGCEILGLLVVDYFATCALEHKPHEDARDGPDNDQIDGLRPLEMFFVADARKYADVYKSVMDTLHRVLQQYGLHHEGWLISLRILNGVLDGMADCTGVELPDLLLLRCAFSIVKLICSDFMSTALSQTTLTIFIRLLGRISRTDIDLNVSLTSIGQLWDVADATVTKGWHDEWMTVLRELASGCGDARCEVRNSCVQTIFRTLEVHCRLDWSVPWKDIFHLIVIPISLTICSSHSATAPIGHHDGMAHHSRDTLEKQWDETRVLFIQGITQIFREHLDKTIDDEFTEFYISQLHSAIVSSGKAELAAVGVSCFEVFCQLASSESWGPCGGSAWQLFKDICAKGMSEHPMAFEQSTLISLCKTLKSLLEHFEGAILAESKTLMIEEAFDGLMKCISHPPTPADRIYDSDCMNELQKSIMEIVNGDLLNIFYERLGGCKSLMCTILCYQVLQKPPATDICMVSTLDYQEGRPESVQKSVDFYRTAFAVAFMEFIKYHLQWFEQDEMPMDAIGHVIKGLGRWAGELKYRAPTFLKPTTDTSPPWQTATSVLLSLIDVIIKSHTSNYDCWSLCTDSLSQILLTATESVPVSISAEALTRDEDFDRSSLVFAAGLLEHKAMPSDCAVRLLTAISQASRLFNISTSSSPNVSLDDTEQVVKPRFAADAIMILFKHGSGHQPPEAFPILISRISNVFSDFLESQRMLGTIPAPQYHYMHV